VAPRLHLSVLPELEHLLRVALLLHDGARPAKAAALLAVALGFGAKSAATLHFYRLQPRGHTTWRIRSTFCIRRLHPVVEPQERAAFKMCFTAAQALQSEAGVLLTVISVPTLAGAERRPHELPTAGVTAPLDGPANAAVPGALGRLVSARREAVRTRERRALRPIAPRLQTAPDAGLPRTDSASHCLLATPSCHFRFPFAMPPVSPDGCF